MKRISQLFLQGLFAILPIAVTLAVLFWLGTSAEALLGPLLRWIFPAEWYVPGMGILSGFIFVILVGILLNAYLFRQIGALADRVFNRVPLVRTIYGSVRDIAKFASGSQNKDELQQAVLVTLEEDVQLIGFVTGESPAMLVGDRKMISVYLPMSYQIGGYTLMLPESKIKPLNISVQDAMRYVLTAGMTGLTDKSIVPK